MPSHQERVASAPLPKDYQFGDARGCAPKDADTFAAGDTITIIGSSLDGWRAVKNEHAHAFDRFDPNDMAYVCRCGARRFETEFAE